ncbi:MAG: DMT family transporter [Nitrospirae bacterium]|nr:MAG: DMT family transporter [Nitrospirota bacterium]
MALACALANATSDALLKRSLRPGNERLLAWARLGFALPLLYLACAVAPPWGAAGPAAALAALPRPFFVAIALGLPLEVAAVLLYTRALRRSPLGLTIPFLSLTPVFLLAAAPFTPGGRLTGGGIAGVALVAAGGYLLNAGRLREGWLAPVRAIGREPGSRLMILVALIYAATSTCGKVAIAASSPLLFAAVYFTALFLLFAPLAAAEARGAGWTAARAALLPGLLYGLMILSHVASLALANVAYMIAVKRSSLLFAILYGRLLYGERGLAGRLAGGAAMVAGIALIAGVSP